MIMIISDAVPLTPADVTWLKDRVPADVIDQMIKGGDLIIDEQKARNYGRV